MALHTDRDSGDSRTAFLRGFRATKDLRVTGVCELGHPTCSLDLTLTFSDYYLFHSMAYFLQGRQFNNEEEDENSVYEFFGSKYKYWYLSKVFKR